MFSVAFWYQRYHQGCWIRIRVKSWILIRIEVKRYKKEP
jgi:hypothetical protein